MNKFKHLGIRLTLQEHNQIKSAAFDEGVDISTYVKNKIFGAESRRDQILNEILIKVTTFSIYQHRQFKREDVDEIVNKAKTILTPWLK
jgi:hypothetical protein